MMMSTHILWLVEFNKITGGLNTSNENYIGKRKLSSVDYRL